MDKIVKIIWLDSLTHSPWTELDEAQCLEPVAITSIGYIIEDNVSYVTVVGMIRLEECVSMIQAIPRGCILKIEVINDSSCTITKEG